jgi:dephospho-CoA kinase
MLRVGLTGGLGSGKSTVAGFLRELGAEIAQADELGRQLMEPGQTVYDEIVQVFGPEVVRADGSLDRARLAELAFRASQRLERHCASSGHRGPAPVDAGGLPARPGGGCGG